MSIEKGVLYIVATPIGNLEDLTPRAQRVLREVDLVAVEDSRHSRPMLQQFSICTPLVALHDHNEIQLLKKIVKRLEAGGSVALISDAGTPLISDPGFPLVRACHRQGITVSPIPGPSAAICALSVAGLPADRFTFEGFPERKATARRKQFETLLRETRSMIFYESSHRIRASLSDMADLFGHDRSAALARELTKVHETVVRSNLGQLCELLNGDPDQRRGEFVIIVAGAVELKDEITREAEKVLRELVKELPISQAASLAARITGAQKNLLYKVALSWQRE